MEFTVVIDCFHGGELPSAADDAIVAVDVIRATTTAVTAVAGGRRCYPVSSVSEARTLSASLQDALVAGESSGDQPSWFQLQNSPSALIARDDPERPLVLLSSSGTPLLRAAERFAPTYVACLRNRSAVVRHLLRTRHDGIALLGAGTHGEFREEDQLCCAWIGAALTADGYRARDSATADLIEQWRDARLDDLASGRSADYLRRTGQESDLSFVLAHDDDIDVAHRLADGEVVPVGW